MEVYYVFVLFAHLFQVLNAGPPVEVTPDNIILLENRPLEVKCRVGVPITYCRFAVPGVSNALSLRPGIAPHQGIQYLGAGLEKGECGMLIQSVSSKHSGVIQCSMGFIHEPTESTGNLTLVVAKAPDPPLLQLYPVNNYRDFLQEGDSFQANCKIRNARPIANISWYLGSEPIYDRLSPPDVIEENGLKTISQNLTRKVTYADHGKDLKCVAGHIALGQGSINHSIYKLNVRFPPKPKSQELEKFGFTIGQPGKIVVTFQANPIPIIVWKVDQDTLKQGTRDRTGRFEASVLQQKGAGIWDAVLNINIVRPEEVEKRYTLIAQNELGQESYKVAISTSPEPPADITAGAIVGIVIAVLVILLLVFILIFARATGRWCFAGGVPRPPGESLLPHRWSLGKVTEKNPRKVNSLIYKDYTLVQYEDGSKSYVSPEEKAQLLLDGKIKREASKMSLECEKSTKKILGSDTDSESGYEIPMTPDESSLSRKPKSCEELDRTPVVKSGIKRNSSFPFSDVEASPGDNGRINLPPYIVPIETSLTFPMTKQKNKRKKKKTEEVDSKKEPEKQSENILTDFDNNVVDLPAEFRVKEGEVEKPFVLKPPSTFWSRNKKKLNEEPDSLDQKVSKNPFSMPWRKSKELEKNETEHGNPDESVPELRKDSKRFSLKLPKLSWSKGSKDKQVESADESDVQDGGEVEVSKRFGEEDEDSKSDEEDKREPFMRRDVRTSQEVTDDVEEQNEVFPTRQPSEEGINNLEDVERKEEKPIFQPLRLPSDVLKGKERRYKKNGKIDTNPLRKMFGFKGVKHPKSIDLQEVPRERSSAPADMTVRETEEPLGMTSYPRPLYVTQNDGYYPEVDTVRFAPNSSSREGESGEVEDVTEVQSVSSDKASDTESADHGSADKSSMSKLTSEKQPKKLMSGLLGSFKIGKSKDRVADNDHTKNPSSFEITVKEQPEEMQTEGVRTEGIVYAELDMARSPGNVMRRDDEKIEYAEIIYPGSKLTTERAMEELKKSRENLTSSRENLTEVDEAFTTMTSPEGKKEAAV